jgi:hypothetical protein
MLMLMLMLASDATDADAARAGVEKYRNPGSGRVLGSTPRVKFFQLLLATSA